MSSIFEQKIKKIFSQNFQKMLDKPIAKCYNSLVVRGWQHRQPHLKKIKTLKKFEKTLDKLNKICYNNLVNKGWGNRNPTEKNLKKSLKKLRKMLDKRIKI